jgi:hypothetical protein
MKREYAYDLKMKDLLLNRNASYVNFRLLPTIMYNYVLIHYINILL